MMSCSHYWLLLLMVRLLTSCRHYRLLLLMVRLLTSCRHYRLLLLIARLSLTRRCATSVALGGRVGGIGPEPRSRLCHERRLSVGRRPWGVLTVVQRLALTVLKLLAVLAVVRRLALTVVQLLPLVMGIDGKGRSLWRWPCVHWFGACPAVQGALFRSLATNHDTNLATIANASFENGEFVFEGAFVTENDDLLMHRDICLAVHPILHLRNVRRRLDEHRKRRTDILGGHYPAGYHAAGWAVTGCAARHAGFTMPSISPGWWPKWSWWRGRPERRAGGRSRRRRVCTAAVLSRKAPRVTLTLLTGRVGLVAVVNQVWRAWKWRTTKMSSGRWTCSAAKRGRRHASPWRMHASVWVVCALL